MKIDLLKNSFINISKNIYDSDFINLAKINDEKICFDDNTLFLSKSSKDKYHYYKEQNYVYYIIITNKNHLYTNFNIKR